MKVVCVEGDPEAHRTALEAGAGAGKLLFFDAPSGLAGDMVIAALIDLGVPRLVVERSVAALGLEGFSLKLSRAYAGAVGGTHFDVIVDGEQPQRSYREIDELLRRASLDPAVRDLARGIFLTLGRAEAEVHRIPLDDVHFHEVGAVDSVVDIVGAAAALTHLGATAISSPLPMGSGSVVCQHGVIPLPAPATLNCLKGVPTYDAGIAAELVTPTGAAIIKTVARQFLRWPSFAPQRIGYGCGTRSLHDRPNALRVVLGSANEETALETSHVLLEANVDDMTGELAAHAVAKLLAGGAADAWAEAIVMKKGRPGLKLAALAPRARASELASLMLAETSSIGVRRVPVGRIERPRELRPVETKFGTISVKVSGGPFGPPQMKPEFDECVAAAERAGVPVRSVIAEVMAVLGRQA